MSARSMAPSVATTTPPPDLSQVEELLTTMKQTLGTLGATFDTLGEQTARIATLGPAMDAAHQVHRLRKQLQSQDRKHEERIGEIKSLLRDVLKEQIIAHLSSHVHEMIREGVAKIVKARVATELQGQIPPELREKVEDHRRQLAHVKLSLHNSEARRANALLRSNHLTEPLHPLLKPNGELCAIFPPDLATLFGQNSAKAKQLTQDFGLPVCEDEVAAREKNLNKFMQHIGVSFLMVPYDRKVPLIGGNA
ncbi:hypothetical protein BU17DRAFT_74400 [Hysterangium stoloniferum]|nr:hypothetical protein BU17DRAFT_74400 [Hysterangium stoloniferum]